MEKYILPLRYEEGTYKLKDVVLKTTEQDNDHLMIEYDKEPDIINLAEKLHRTYSLGVDPLENVMVEYRSPYSFFQKGEGNNLEKVYVKTEGGKELMLYWGIEEVYDNRRDDIFEMIQDITVRSANELAEGLKEAPSPLPPLVMEYYLEGNDSSFNLMGAYSEINYYGLTIETDYLRNCLIKSVPADRREVVFHTILMGVYNRLTYEIPAKYELADDFRLFLPERYD